MPTPINELTPQFFENIPHELENGILYISLPFETAIHLCCCGCGYATVTPLSADWWKLTQEEGGLVSLHPSIGNQQFECRSHYWIKRNKVEWC